MHWAGVSLPVSLTSYSVVRVPDSHPAAFPCHAALPHPGAPRGFRVHGVV